MIGTRPEAIKMFPVILALRESAWLMPYVVVTGQHRDMVAPVLKMAGIEPDADLAVARPGQDLNDVVANVVKGLDDLLTELRGG
ncbi:MAG: UDP-N-acetylglucosamine 2-epimerase (non-hydrolyzing), partial [Actinomycetia bacterium]|nr:UDP-N-acetylglucosamine 2-epimerase (non-hydrolyzing) [Actinomycetes bacterium]